MQYFQHLKFYHIELCIHILCHADAMIMQMRTPGVAVSGLPNRPWSFGHGHRPFTAVSKL